ncbi:MAG: VCBS repeat-containing protein [Myxococcales bacterium]|nr:VCBS repeat-containing protein [Myxococcales bacterium]
MMRWVSCCLCWLGLISFAEARGYREVAFQEKGAWRVAWLSEKGRILQEAWREDASWRTHKRVLHEPLLGLAAGRVGMVAYGKRCLWRWGHWQRGKRCVALHGEAIVDVVWTDMDGDGVQGIVVLIKKIDGDGRLVGVNAQDGRWMRLSIERLRRPWMIESADVDGDGKDDLMIGMFRPSYFDRVVRRRLWIYSYLPRRGAFFPKWRGSRFSLPWLDVVPLAERKPSLYPAQGKTPWKETLPQRHHPSPQEKGATSQPSSSPFQGTKRKAASKKIPSKTPKAPVYLAVLEHDVRGKQRVMLYRWVSFGFVGRKVAWLEGSWTGIRVLRKRSLHRSLWLQKHTLQQERLLALFSQLP